MNQLLRQTIASFVSGCLIANMAIAQQVAVSAPTNVVLATDSNATDTALKQAANGTTVVDIAAPSAKGVSSNAWNDFNVGQDGIIFNNSKAPVLTQLGGWADGNRRLAGGEASIILNQVVGGNRSTLLGQVEIAGKSAEFILANPNGITCNGCGFINTPAVSLITGRSRLDANGNLLFDVGGGDFLLAGSGLNASNIDRFDIVSRYAQLNANLYANQLNLITGTNEFNYDSKAINASTTAADASVQFALSTSSLGGMYGNAIRLIGTEKGLGVNLQGVVQSTDDLQITADGNIQLRNVLANNQLIAKSLSGDVATQELAYARYLEIQAADEISNSGLLAARDGILLNARNINQSGNLYAGLNADNTLNSQGVLTLTASNFTNSGDLYVGGGVSNNRSLNLVNSGSMLLKSANRLNVAQLDNRNVLRLQSDSFDIFADSLKNSGQLLHEGKGTLGIQLAQNIDNTGVLGGNGKLNLKASAFNNPGQVFAGDTTLNVALFNNNAGEFESKQLSLDANRFSNQGGRVLALGSGVDSRIAITQDLDNQSGVIYADAANFSLTADSVNNSSGTLVMNDAATSTIHVATSINNNGGTLQANTLSLQAAQFSNDNGEWLSQSLNSKVTTLDNSNGFIQSNRISLSGADLNNTAGVVLSSATTPATLVLNFNQNINNGLDGVIRQLNGDIAINTASFINQGVVDASKNGNINLTTVSATNDGGALNALDRITIKSTDLTNTSGFIAAKELQLDIGSKLINSNAGVLQGAMQLNANDVKNEGSYLRLTGDSALTIAGQFENLAGSVATINGAPIGSVNLQANQITNTGEITLDATNVSLQATQQLNNQYYINGTHNLTLTAIDIDNDAGTIQAKTLTATTSNGVRNSNLGYIGAGSLTINAPDIYNESGATLDSQGTTSAAMLLNAQRIHNNGGTIQSSANDWQLNLANLDNQNGLIVHQGTGTLSITSAGRFVNDGTLFSTNHLRLEVNELENRGTLFSGHQLSLISQLGITNTATGQISAMDATLLQAQQQRIENLGYWYLGESLDATSNTTNSDLFNSGSFVIGSGTRNDDVRLQLNSVTNIGRQVRDVDGALISNGGISYNNSGNLIIDSNSFTNEGDVLALNGGLQWNKASNLGQGLTNDGSLVANNIQLQDITGTLSNNGLMQAQSLDINATRLINTRTVESAGAGAWSIYNTRISNSGDLINHATDWTLSGVIDGSGRVFHTGTGTFSLALANGSDLTGGYLDTQGRANLSNGIQGGAISLGVDQNNLPIEQRTTLRAAQGITLTGANFVNAGAQLVTDADLLLQTSVTNQASSLLQAASISLIDNSRTFNFQNDGDIKAAALTFTGNQLSNSSNLLVDSAVVNANQVSNSRLFLIDGTLNPVSSITTQTLDNQNGVLQFGGDNTTIDASTRVDNENGQLFANAITINTPTLNNRDGVISLRSIASNPQPYSLQTQTLDNTRGLIQLTHEDQAPALYNSLSIVASAQLNNTDGNIALQNLQTNPTPPNPQDKYVNDPGTNKLSIRSGNYTSNDKSLLISDGKLTIDSQDAQSNFTALTNAGLMQALSDFTINAAGLQNSGDIGGGSGSTVTLNLNNNNLVNSNQTNDARIFAVDTLVINGVDALSNANSIVALNSLTLNTDNVLGIGKVFSNQLTLNMSGDLTVQAGESIIAPGALTINTPGNITNAGEINAAAQFNLSGVQLHNQTGGKLIAGIGFNNEQGDDSLPSVLNFSQSIVNEGLVSVMGHLDVFTPSFANTGNVVTGGNLVFDLDKNGVANTGSFTNTGGTIYSFGDLNIKHANLIQNQNNANVIAGRDMTLTGNELVNNSSRVEAMRNLDVQMELQILNRTEVPGSVLTSEVVTADGPTLPDGYQPPPQFFYNNQWWDWTALGSTSTITTTQTRSPSSIPGVLRAGNDLSLSVSTANGSIQNEYSQIFAGQDLYLDGKDLSNLTANDVVTQHLESSVAFYQWPCLEWGAGSGLNCQITHSDSFVYDPVVISDTPTIGSIRAARDILGNLSGSVVNGANTAINPSSPLDPTPANSTPFDAQLVELIDKTTGRSTARDFLSREEAAGLPEEAKESIDSDDLGDAEGNDAPDADQDITNEGDATRDQLSKNIPVQLAAANAQEMLGNVWPLISFSVLPLNFDVKNLGSLFVVNKSPNAKYLIETRPEFTSVLVATQSRPDPNAPKNPDGSVATLPPVLGSDYLLGLLGYDPDKSLKRLGDAFYENQLIRDALIAQTNSRYLEGVETDYELMQALMDNAVEASKSLELSVGVELTAAQCASLTKDMMWLVKRRVMGQDVLVPQLYLTSISPEKLAAAKAVIGANGNINLKANNINNQGSIYSGGNTTLVANTLRNTANLHTNGDLSLLANSLQNTANLSAGNNLNLVTRGNLQQDGKLFAQGDVRLLSAGGITNTGSIQANRNVMIVGQGDVTNAKSGQIKASGDALLQSTGANVVLERGKIEAKNLTLDAANDVLLLAQKNQSTRVVNGVVFNSTTHDTNQLNIDGNVNLKAGRDVRLEGGDINAGGDAQGCANAADAGCRGAASIIIQAGRNVVLQAVANESGYEYHSKRQDVVHQEVNHDLVNLNAKGDVVINAGQDANLTGVNVTAGQSIAIAATRDTNITAVVDSVYDYSQTTKKGSLGKKKTTTDEKLRETAVGGNLTAGGDVLVNVQVQVDADGNGQYVDQASRTVNLTGVNINAKGNVLMHADGDVNVSSIDTHSIDFHQEQKSSIGGLKKTDKGTSTLTTTPQQANINAGGTVRATAGSDINLTASNITAKGNVILDAKNDVNVLAAEQTTDTQTWDRTTRLITADTFTGLAKDAVKHMDKMSGDAKLSSEKGYTSLDDAPHATAGNHFNKTEGYTASDVSRESVAGTITSGGGVAITAGRDANLQGTDVNAAGSISIEAGRDVNLQAMANTHNTASNSKRNSQSHKEVNHNTVNLDSGANVRIKAGQDANLIGTNIDALNNVSISATRDTNISAVVDSVKDFEKTTQKGSWGKKKTTTDESLNESAVGGVIDAGNNVLINAHVNSEGRVIGDKSGNVNLLGAVINAGNSVAISADEDVNISGIQLQQSDFHRTQKSGSLGMKKNDQGAVDKGTRMENASITATNNIVMLGENIKLVSANVETDGNINMEAVDELLIGAGQVTQSIQNWDTQSGIFSGGKIYSKQQHKDGVTDVATQASNIRAGGVVNAKAGSIKIEGSNVSGDQGVGLSADIGDIEITAATTHTQAYSYDKDLSVGLGDVGKNILRPDQMVKNKNGRLTIKLADAEYSEVDEKTTATTAQSSVIESKHGDVIANASAGKITIAGSEIHADEGDVGLIAANGIDVTTATETFDLERKSITATAELSVVVQHQAVEIVMAAKNVKEAEDKLKQAKKDYKNFKRNLDTLETELKTLEADYANKTPGVSYADIVELRELINDTKGDDAYMKAGIVLAAVNLTTAVTTLVQQIAAAAASSGTYGFNAGVQLDLDATKTKTETHDTFEKGSTITANNIVMQTGKRQADETFDARGTATNIHGSSIKATDSVIINTGKLDVTAGEATHESNTETMHGHLTAQMTVYGAAGGVSVSGSFDRNKSGERSTTYTNSEITADKISITTTDDANFKGATVRADSQLDMDIGGNLNVESVQNRSSSRSVGFGISGGVSFGGKSSQEKADAQNAAHAADPSQPAASNNAFTKNLHGPGDVTGVSGVNGGFSVSNGRSSSRETVLTSITSGGAANINVKGHTQLTGALIATTDKDGNDLGNLNFSTGSFDFTDLRNTNYNSNTSFGLSTNISVSGGKSTKDGSTTDSSTTTSPKSGSDAVTAPTSYSTTTTGKELKANSSNLTFSNSQSNSASKTFATLGNGNISIGGVKVEKDGEATDAGSLLAGLNRDTDKLDKKLWNSGYSQTVDATLDHRLLSKEGRADIANDFKNLPENIKTIAANAAEDARRLKLTVQSLGQNLDSDLSVTMSNAGEKAANQLMRAGYTEQEVNQFFRDSPQIVEVVAQVQVAADALKTHNPNDPLLPIGQVIIENLDSTEIPELNNHSNKVPDTIIESVVMVLGDGKRYMDDLREKHPTYAKMAEIAMTGATGGVVKKAVTYTVQQGMNEAIASVAGGLLEKVEEVKRTIIDYGAEKVTKADEQTGEFREKVDTQADNDKYGRIEDGTGFAAEILLGVMPIGTLLGLKNKGSDGAGVNTKGEASSVGSNTPDRSGNSESSASNSGSTSEGTGQSQAQAAPAKPKKENEAESQQTVANGDSNGGSQSTGESTDQTYAGGAHRDTSKPTNDQKDSHHCPAQSCYNGAPISSENGPAIQMDPIDHKATASRGSSDAAKAYRAKQEELLAQGKLMEAVQMDVDDIRSKFGPKYDAAIEQMLRYSRTLNPDDFKRK